jgi:DNA-binding response OmpR family regulator
MPTTSKPPRLLCVGKESDLLETRCTVLKYNGYDARSASLWEAETLLSQEAFDLVIISATLNVGETGRVVSAVGESRTIVLRGVTFARDLLAEVERRLA